MAACLYGPQCFPAKELDLMSTAHSGATDRDAPA
ncbi:hypothetical protein BJ981_002811 [Sphaerisporangium krabiense]|uniref:Uncharacterized protein n=1 Tax=Sphaerisporangium krabiense TaxID=763782 RepID=A0A7W9DQ28_9ACTN|nr:hypothetical protein [Sphaerisporangium krabiense]